MTKLADAGIPVTVTCRVLKLSRQPYYRWLAGPITDSEVVEAYRANALFDAHKDDPEFGHRLLERRVRAALNLTPLGFVQRLRTERARHLSATTDLTSAEIALRVGYANAETLRSLLRRERRSS